MCATLGGRTAPTGCDARGGPDRAATRRGGPPRRVVTVRYDTGYLAPPAAVCATVAPCALAASATASATAPATLSLKTLGMM